MKTSDVNRIIDGLKPINKITVPKMTDPIGMSIHSIRLNSYMDAKNTFYFKPHRHSFFELYFIVSGSAGCYVGDMSEPIEAKAGDVVLMRPGVDHTLIECSSDFVRLAVCFELDDVEKNALTAYVNDALLSFPAACVRASEGVLAAVAAISPHVTERGCLMPYMLRNDIFCLISELSAMASVGDEPTVDVMSEDALLDSRYVYAKKFIKDNIRRGIRTEDVAANVHLSSKQLNRLFLKYAEMTVFDYIQQKRAGEAKRLLLNKNLSIAQISEMLAFSDEFYFSRFFKRNTGFPPHRFRLLNGGR